MERMLLNLIDRQHLLVRFTVVFAVGILIMPAVNAQTQLAPNVTPTLAQANALDRENFGATLGIPGQPTRLPSLAHTPSAMPSQNNQPPFPFGLAASGVRVPNHVAASQPIATGSAPGDMGVSLLQTPAYPSTELLANSNTDKPTNDEPPYDSTSARHRRPSPGFAADGSGQ